MAITYDNASSAVGTNVSSLQWTHTAGGTNNLLAFVGATAGFFSAVGYNGQALTLRAQADLNITFQPIGAIYTLTGNPTGANTASCVLDDGSGVDSFGAGMISYNGVSQGAPLKTAFTATAGAATVFNMSLSTTANNVVIALLGSALGGVTYTDPATQQRRLAISAGNVQFVASEKTATGATTSLSWTSSVSTVQYECAIIMSQTAITASSPMASLPLLGAGQG